MPHASPNAVAAPPVAPRRRGPGRGPLLGALFVGIGLRAWIAWGSRLGTADGDEAISAAVARGVLHGRVPTFFPGQGYGGTGEEVLIAAVFRVLGVSAASLKLVPLLLGLAGVALTWRIGRRTVGEPAARVAAVMAAVWPLGNLYWSTKARGFYGVALVLGLATVLLALPVRDQGPSTVDARRDWLLLGLAVGLAWWTSPLAMLVVGPTLLWLLVVQRPRPLDAALAAAGAVAGMLPWLAWNLGHRWGSFVVPPQQQAHNSYLDHLVLFARRGVPLALGVRVPQSARWLPGPVVGPVATLVAVAALGWAAWHLPRSARMVAGLALAYPFLLALSPYSYFLDDTRYLYLLHPLLALVLAAGLVRHRLELAGLGIALGLSVVGLVALDQRHEVDVRPLASALDRHHLDRVGADYWVAYPLELATDGRIVGTPLAGAIRSPAAAQRVRAGRRVAMVWAARSWGERRFLRRLGARPVRERFAVDGYDVFVLDHREARDLIPLG